MTSKHAPKPLYQSKAKNKGYLPDWVPIKYKPILINMVIAQLLLFANFILCRFCTKATAQTAKPRWRKTATNQAFSVGR